MSAEQSFTFAKKLSLKYLNSKIERALQKDSTIVVERRVKVLTEGLDDTADPCTPVEIVLPNLEKVWAVYFSGGRVIHYSSLHEILQGGVRDFQKIEVQTREGTPLMLEPYHLAEAIWDTELVSYRNIQGELSYVGHGGMMERENPSAPCNVAHHNFRRSRHSFQIEFQIDPESKALKEVWKNLGPVHGNKPCNQGRWISRTEDQAHAHGYGSRMIRTADGNPWKDTAGFMWMTYEEVTEEAISANGARLPYGTKIFARQMNADLTAAVGKAVLLSDYSPWSNLEKPFQAAHRFDASSQPAGFLIEGPNPLLLNIAGKEYWTIFFSAGDFVSDYGNYMMYREKSMGPIGPYNHYTDASGELINLTAQLVKDFELTWAGRLNCFYDDSGKLWGLMHGIFKSDIPDGWKKSGWPRTQAEFIGYARRTLLVPLSAEIKNNTPCVFVAEVS